MNLFEGLRRQAASRTPKPQHIEIWGHLVRTNRALTRMMAASAAISFLSAAGLLWAMTTALSKPLVYYVDSSGSATYGGRLANASHPKEVEVSFVAKEFLRRTVAYNSLTAPRDFAEGWNLMTGELQAQEQQRFDDWQASRGMSFVDYVVSAGIRTQMTFDGLDIESHGGKHFFVRAKGTLETWPLDADAEAAPKAKAFESQLSLVATKRTESAPNGLLVSHHSISFFEVPSASDALPGATALAPKSQTP